MESDNTHKQVVITHLLPFMNEKFFWAFLDRENLPFESVKVESREGLPGKNIYSYIISLCSYYVPN